VPCLGFSHRAVPIRYPLDECRPADVTGARSSSDSFKNPDPDPFTIFFMTTDLLPDLDGRVVLPSDAGYDEARLPWNTAIDLRPAAVVEAASVADVQAAVRYARSNGLRVAPQATGHGAEALDGDLVDAVLLRTQRLDAIVVDPAARTARVGAGATAGALARVAGEHGLAATVGLAPSVGVAGLALGGGVGWLSRAHGLAANTIMSLDVVTADGVARHVDAGNDPDLFFALRGGGGRYALVTGLELALHPVDEVSAGTLAWPVEATAEVLEQARRWALDAPDSLSTVVRVVAMPPLESIPEPIRGRRIVMVVAAHLGPHQDAERLIAPLRGSRTLMDTFGPIGLADLVTVAGDPEEPGPSRGDGLLLKELTPDVVRAVAGIAADASLSALGVVELRQLGGALAPATWARLERIRNAYDPDRLIAAAHGG